MRAATVVQILQDFLMFYCMFYFTCDRSLNPNPNRGDQVDASRHNVLVGPMRRFAQVRYGISSQAPL